MEAKSFELTLPQQLELERMRREVSGLSREEAVQLLLKATRLLMLKDNVIRNLIKKQNPTEFK